MLCIHFKHWYIIPFVSLRGWRSSYSPRAFSSQWIESSFSLLQTQRTEATCIKCVCMMYMYMSETSSNLSWSCVHVLFYWREHTDINFKLKLELWYDILFTYRVMASLLWLLLVFWLPSILMFRVWRSTNGWRPRVVLPAAFVGLFPSGRTPLVIRLWWNGLWPRALVFPAPLVRVLVLMFVIIFLLFLRSVRFLGSFYFFKFLILLSFVSFLSVSLLPLQFTLRRLT